MRNHSFRDRDRQQNERSAGRQRIDEVLDELLAQFSVRFPQFKLVILSRTDDFGPGGNDETASLGHPARGFRP